MYTVWASKQKAFTIVELLIVIVVIAILAAITVVAYTGIQGRARDSQVASAMNAYVKGMTLYYTTYGSLPVSEPACFNGAACWSGTTTTQGAILRTELQKVMGSLPEIPTPYNALLVPNASTSDTPNGGTYSGAYVIYQHSGGQACLPVAGARFLNNLNTTSAVATCRVALELN